MLAFLLYDLKVAVLIAVFYMFYRLLLSRETFHRVNRVVLLLTAVASFVLPLCVITMHETMTVNQELFELNELTDTSEIGKVSIAPDAKQPLWQTLLLVLYLIGAAVTIGHTLLSILKVVLLIRRSERHPQADGITLCVSANAEVAPFSWMHYIVMNRSDYEAHDAAILAHERGHIRLRHSWDVLLIDLLTALQWFNPAVWMLRQDLRAIHEYEADGEVLSQGINARQYQYLLITKAASIGGYSIANGISHSTLKNRIKMMTNMKSKSSHLLKLLALVPIVGITLALNARTVTDYVYDKPQKQQPVKKGKKAGTIKTGSGQDIIVMEAEVDPKSESAVEDSEPFIVRGKVVDQTEKPVIGAAKVFDVVEKMPQYPGGTAALMEFLARNIRYPKEAEQATAQGRVIATFVVEKDGSITGARIVKSVHPLLDEEALRVVNSMPNWEPGTQDGEPVRVKYTVPITFRLDAGTKEEPAPEPKYVLEIDGKVVDDSEIANIPSGDIVKMDVVEAKNGEPKRILITTKAKK